MRSEKSRYRLALYLICVACVVLSSSSLLFAAIIDRVVAYVDNTAITRSELDRKYAETALISPAVTREEVLNTMINRILLVKQARKIRLRSEGEDELLKEYVDLKIRALIRISDEETRNFYERHIADFPGKELEDLREEIENYLTDQQLNRRLREHIAELRSNACVTIQRESQIQE